MKDWESKMRGAYDTFNMDEEESRRLWARIQKSMDEADGVEVNSKADADVNKPSRVEEYSDATGRTIAPTTFIMVDRPESVVSIHAEVTPLTSGQDSALTQAQAKELIEMINWDEDSWK